MSKKTIYITSIVLLVVIALVSAYLMFGKKPVPSGANAPGAAGSSSVGQDQGQGSSTASAPGKNGSAPTSITAGIAPSKSSGGGSSAGGSGGSSGGGSTGGASSLKPFPPLADPKLPAIKTAVPVPAGQKLAPLTVAPPSTISGLKADAVPDGSQYKITMRPYGIGPAMVLGSRLVIRVDSATPVNKAPADGKIANVNMLVLVDTTHAGTVTKGGTYTATLTFRDDGTKLLPILSDVSAAK